MRAVPTGSLLLRLVGFGRDYTGAGLHLWQWQTSKWARAGALSRPDPCYCGLRASVGLRGYAGPPGPRLWRCDVWGRKDTRSCPDHFFGWGCVGVRARQGTASRSAGDPGGLCGLARIFASSFSGLRAGLCLRTVSPEFLLLRSAGFGPVFASGLAVGFAASLYISRLNVLFVGRG